MDHIIFNICFLHIRIFKKNLKNYYIFLIIVDLDKFLLNLEAVSSPSFVNNRYMQFYKSLAGFLY